MQFFGLLGVFAMMAATAFGQWSTPWPGGPTAPHSYESFPTTIPARLTICYENAALNNRFRRMPQSMDSLVALIRKVEAHPDTRLWTAGKMASTLIHRFRYDGIIDVGAVAAGSLSIVAERVESDKFRMQWRLIPGMSTDFPESSLTQEEKCSLHWMLSYTVNHTARSEELGGRSRMLGGGSHEDGDHDHDHDDHDSSDTEGGETPENERADNEEASAPAEDGEPEHHEEENHEETPDENQEENHDEDHEAEAKGSSENKEEEGDQAEGSEADGENEGEGGEADHEHQTGDEDFGADAVSEDDDSNFWGKRRRRQTTPPKSSSPLEGGVVHTRFGTVAVGPVLAGVAAGMSPQSVKLKDFIRDPTLDLSQNSMERTIESPWVATVAGEIAHTALLRVPRKMESMGPRGSWNSTFCPREYRLAKNEHSLMTNAEFYGGIDGLLISKRVQTWDSSSYLKLSGILEMYYSVKGVSKDETFRACNRLNNYRNPSVVDPSVLKAQALNAALVLYARGIDGVMPINPNVRPADQIGQYVNTTINDINFYIGNNANIDADYPQCFGSPPTPTTELPATYTDLTFVVDQFNDHSDIEKQKEFAAALATVLDIQVGGSRMEVVSGKDATAFINLNDTLNRAELACRITSLPISYSERRISDTLSKMRARILLERSAERSGKISGGNTRAILIFVTSYTTGTAEKDKIKAELAKMLVEMPDVHIMFATMASPEEFRPFVADFNKDVLKMINYQKYSDAAVDVVKRLLTVGARLTYPSCSDSSTNAASLEAQFTYSGFLNPYTVQYFRIGPEHYYSSNTLVLRFKSTYGVAKYCLSSNKANPSNGDTCKNALNSDETVEFRYTQPCGKVSSPQACPVIYVAAIGLGIDDNVPCSEAGCHTPDQVKFTFSHEGMQCKGVSSPSGSSSIGALSITVLLLICWLTNGHY